MSKTNKNAKTVTKTAKAAKTDKAKKPSKVVAKLAPTAKISFLKDRPKGAGGPKTEVLALVPRKGAITFKALTAKAEAAELNTARLAKWISVMAKNGRVAIAA